MNIALFLMSGMAILGQTKEDDALLAAAHVQGQAFTKAYMAGDAQKLAALAWPAFLKKAGGKEEWTKRWQQHFEENKKRERKILVYEVLAAKELHRAGKDLVVFLPLRVRAQDPDRKVAVDDTLVAASADAGKTWLFVQRDQIDDDDIREMFPDWPEKLRLPPRGKLIEEDLKQGEHTSAKDNYKLTYPKGWKKGSFPGGELVLQQNKDVLAVHADHTNPPPADMLKELLDQVQRSGGEAFKELKRDKARVANVDAIVLHFEADAPLGVADAWVAVFENHGITYRIMAVAAKEKEKSAALEKDFLSLLSSFAFLGERKEWLAMKEGTPARTAFLAGLASIELNRPRWKENSFDERSYLPADGPLESLNFRLFNGAASIVVVAFDRRTTAKAELESLQERLQERLSKPTVKRIVVKGPKGFVAGVEVNGFQGPQPQQLLGCAFVKDGMSVQLSLECRPSQRSAVQKDWDQLVASFRFEDPKTTPPLFPLRFDRGDNRTPHPALAVLLKKATAVYSGERMYSVHSISPDGQQALVLGGAEGAFLESIGDRARIPLARGGKRYGAERPTPGIAAAWSRDGKQIAYALGTAIAVRPIGEGEAVEHRGQAFALAFLADNRLLAVQQIGTGDADVLEPRFTRFIQQKLVRFDDEDAAKVLLEFPLARFAHLAVSPDGKRLALVTNKDSARTAPRPGNLYVANADGSGLRPLTKGPEVILSVAWSDDGRWLHVVRRRDRDTSDGSRSPDPFPPYDRDGYAMEHGAGDLFRISPETGEAENLTRCGMITAAWVQGDFFLLRIAALDVPLAQSGIFKISAADLAMAAATLPEPRHGDFQEAARKIAARIKAALAPQTLSEVVPTPEVIEKLAKTFADTATNFLGEPFDFSGASLDSLRRWATALEPTLASEPALVFGMGAYYGETLRKVTRAEWRLEPVAIGDWLPGKGYAGNALVDVVLPFTDVFRANLRNARGQTVYMEPLSRQREQKLILAYPPAIATRVLREATPKAYLAAQSHFDKGEIKEGLELFVPLVREHANNASLAQDVLELTQTAGLSALADRLAQTAVDAGSNLPVWLIRRADGLIKTDPARALDLYRKAVQAPDVPADAFLKLGKQLAAAGKQPLAEACFRRAYVIGSQVQRNQARELLGLAKASRNEL